MSWKARPVRADRAGDADGDAPSTRTKADLPQFRAPQASDRAAQVVGASGRAVQPGRPEETASIEAVSQDEVRPVRVDQLIHPRWRAARAHVGRGQHASIEAPSQERGPCGRVADTFGKFSEGQPEVRPVRAGMRKIKNSKLKFNVLDLGAARARGDAESVSSRIQFPLLKLSLAGAARAGGDAESSATRADLRENMCNVQANDRGP